MATTSAATRAKAETKPVDDEDFDDDVVEAKSATAPAPAPAPVGIGSVRTSKGKIIRKPPPGSRRALKGKQGPTRKGPFVKYVGDASHRRITPADWATVAGCKPPPGGYQVNTWEPKNDKMIECSHFSEEQLDYLLIDDMRPAGGHSFLEMDYGPEGKLMQVVDEE